MDTDILKTLISLCRHLGIQVLLFGPGYGQIEHIDYGFRRKIFGGFDYGGIADILKRHLEADVCYLCEDDLKLHYTLFRFPESVSQKDTFPTDASSEPGCEVCCIGPILYESMDGRTLRELAEKLGILPPMQQDFMEFYHRIPLFPSYDMWNQLIGFFLGQCGISLKSLLLDNNALNLFAAAPPDYVIPDIPESAQNDVEERYKWENALMSAVAAGNLQQSMDAYFQLSKYKIPARVADPLRDRKNLLFAFNTLLRKAVERSHVHPLHIDNLSRQLSIQVESILAPDQLVSMPHIIIRKYCMLVNNYSRRAFSSLVQTCMDYVDFHYNSELSLSGLATMCSVSSSYLSSLFKREVGMTITDYIHYTRIHQSLILLNASNLSVGEIASRCGFSDANYFTRTFKKLQGKTPKAYRGDMGIN